MAVPTKNAVAGKFQSRGDDFVHYEKDGNLMSRVDAAGVHYCADFITHDGVSSKDLQAQIDVIKNTPAIPGVPTSDGIDIGTF